MFGELSYEMQVQVPASEAWDLFGTLRLGQLAREMKELFKDLQVIHGDGSVGTIVLIELAPGEGQQIWHTH